MQKLDIMGYTKQQVIDALHAKYSPRFIKFRYDLLDKNERKKKILNNVLSGEITMQKNAEIKRIAKFTMSEDSDINWLSDRIQPFFMQRMPGNNWIEWSLGIFLLSTPTRSDENGIITRDVEAYDGLQVLKDDKIDGWSWLLIPAGTNYYDAVVNLLIGAGITKINIQRTDKVLRIDKEFEPGTSKLTIINSLLAEINYTQLWVDESGTYTAREYKSPADRAAEYVYEDNETSVLYPGLQDTLDLFAVPNKWFAVASNAESEPVTSVYINENPNSLTSIQSRGRTISEFIKLDDIADQATLDAYVMKKAYEASQVYGTLTFQTATMPHHSFNDMLQIKYNKLNINEKYEEIAWTLPLQIGCKMKHECSKVVQI